MKCNIETLKNKMLVKYPFFGSVISNVDYKESKRFSIAATDGEIIYYNPKRFEKLSIDEQTFVLAHEVCHIAFNHILRSEDKDPETWNIATDAVINQFLKKDGLKLIDGVVNIEEAINYDAEELYEKLMKEKQHDSKLNQKKSAIGKKSKQQNQGSSGQEGQNQQQNQNGSGQDDQKQEQNQNGSGQDDKKQEQNQSSSGKDDKKQEQNKSGSGQEDQKQEQNKSGSGQEDQKQEQNKSGSGQEDQKQEQNQNGSGKDDQKQEQNKSGLGQDDQKQEENKNGSGDEIQDKSNDNHDLWADAVKKNKEKQQSKKDKKKDNSDNEKKDEVQKKQKELEKMGEKKAFKENLNEKKQQLEKLKGELAKEAATAGKSTDSDLLKIENIGIANPLIDWRYILREAIKRDVDWSYKNATFEDGVLTSRLEEQPLPDTEILLDTSGSINEVLLINFLRECKNILQQSKLKVGCFDTKFYGFNEIRTEEDIENMRFVGGGGTDFNTAVNAFSRRVDNKIIFTDGEAPMPEKSMNAVWIVFGNNKINPLGGKVITITKEQLDKLCFYKVDGKKRVRCR